MIDEEVSDTVYRMYWEYIRSVVSKAQLKELCNKELLTEEEFDREKHNINIIFLGKLNCTYERYCKIKSYYNKVNKKRNDSIEEN